MRENKLVGKVVAMPVAGEVVVVVVEGLAVEAEAEVVEEAIAVAVVEVAMVAVVLQVVMVEVVKLIQMANLTVVIAGVGDQREVSLESTSVHKEMCPSRPLSNLATRWSLSTLWVSTTVLRGWCTAR